MGRKSFLYAAAAGKVKTEKSAVKGLIAGDTHRVRRGSQQRAHRARHRPIRTAREGEDEPVA